MTLPDRTKKYAPAITFYGEKGQLMSIPGPMLPPYGDDYDDQNAILQGINYSKIYEKK